MTCNYCTADMLVKIRGLPAYMCSGCYNIQPNKGEPMKKTKTTSKKTTKKELLAAMKQRKTTQEALWKELSKAWGEIHELKRSAQEHRAKIHNLNGDTATLFDRTKSLQTSNTSLLTRVFTCWK